MLDFNADSEGLSLVALTPLPPLRKGGSSGRFASFGYWFEVSSPAALEQPGCLTGLQHLSDVGDGALDGGGGDHCGAHQQGPAGGAALAAFEVAVTG